MNDSFISGFAAFIFCCVLLHFVFSDIDDNDIDIID